MRLPVLAVLLLTACFPRSRPMANIITKLSGAKTGWYQVKPLLLLDGEGGIVLPPATELEHDEDAAPYMERVRLTHQRQLTPLLLAADTPCEALGGSVGGTLYVMVHGIGGVGDEWIGVVPTLASTGPARLYMYKWFAYTERGLILAGLVAGIQRLNQCFPEDRIVVLGHSAGGVLAAFAASRLHLGPPPARVDIVTVASPLAGMGATGEIADDDDGAYFFNDLGAVRHGYPAARPGVHVLHLRTQYPADRVMKPTRGGYSPNAISAVVKGARIVDLPPTLGHDDSLLYVARLLALDRLP